MVDATTRRGIFSDGVMSDIGGDITVLVGEAEDMFDTGYRTRTTGELWDAYLEWKEQTDKN